jgi:drug/metabolite transporter (DMT)-like permease
MEMGTSRGATATGACAILLWSTLASLTVLTRPIPPLEMTAIAFAIGGAAIAAVAALRGRAGRIRPTLASLLLGVYGLFGYHALYFAALRLAPPAEAQLICSLWAFLIVLFSGLLPGVRLRGRHVVGALFGLAAAALLASAHMALASSTAGSARLGFALAFACALVWSSYSVASRLVAGVPSESIALSCLTVAVLGLLSSLAFEAWVLPPSGRSWLALAGLGLGPIGAAFVLWDVGMKEGNLPLLGVLAYAAPILSTLLLVALGLAEPSWPLAAACGLMVAGAAIAARAQS